MDDPAMTPSYEAQCNELWAAIKVGENTPRRALLLAKVWEASADRMLLDLDTYRREKMPYHSGKKTSGKKMPYSKKGAARKPMKKGYGKKG